MQKQESRSKKKEATRPEANEVRGTIVAIDLRMYGGRSADSPFRKQGRASLFLLLDSCFLLPTPVSSERIFHVDPDLP
jgi:hypothetical protein